MMEEKKITPRKTNTNLDVVLRDFHTVSEKAFAEYRAIYSEEALKKNFDGALRNYIISQLRPNETLEDGFSPYFWSYINGELEALFLYANGIAWFGGENLNHKPFGYPEDYPPLLERDLGIHDFVRETLEKGVVTTGGGGQGSFPHPTFAADYVTWLYKNCDNPQFKDGLAKEVSQVLAEELSRVRLSWGELEGDQEAFNREYSRLAGVLKVIADIGKHEPILAACYEPLLKIIKQNRFSHHRQLTYVCTKIKLRNLVYDAASAVKPSNHCSLGKDDFEETEEK